MIYEHHITSVTFDALVERAGSLASIGTRTIMGIVGAPGAGKSTLASQIVAALGKSTAVLVPMDGYHYANRVLEDLGRRSRKGAIDTFDDGGYASLMERLHAQTGSSEPWIYAPEFRRDLEEPIGSATPVAATVPLVITEGNYLLQQTGNWPRARAVMKEVWYLAPDEQLRHERLITRHRMFGKTPQEAQAWALGSDEDNARMIASSAPFADLIVKLTP
ncbi:MAG: coaE 1 [Micrococcaceae bacterium]|nr:coaE 1 [Micrococcaceae bacterium]